ncbi:MAG: hypothetical protein HY040_07505 [Planctomycetes bacterium]|nr:hypothetical protein [Planctomycetota bacterium]
MAELVGHWFFCAVLLHVLFFVMLLLEGRYEAHLKVEHEVKELYEKLWQVRSALIEATGRDYELVPTRPADRDVGPYIGDDPIGMAAPARRE